jgi:NAD(P)-dependent dehydrogenase (short-subunit alcohol dehydrogenase family)
MPSQEFHSEGHSLAIAGMTAVVTGGASGIGKGITKALLSRGARVVIADIEEPVLEQAVGELSPLGPVEGMRTDVSDEESVSALAEHVFLTHGRCNLLFCNAGVTSGGGGKPWQQEPNDWRWCFGVNVFGVAICTWAFVPRMIESGEPGQVIVTSSGDGGFAPVPTASVYASSKAAASCFTEALNHNLISESTNLRASVFYPSGGLMDTGLFNAQRNRPEHLQRVGEGTGRKSLTFTELKAIVAKMRGVEPEVADLDELGEFVLDGVVERRYIIARDLEETAELLHDRAGAIGRAEMPRGHDLAT